MSWIETLRTALEAVRAHRLRSILTMLGIVIGVSSVILTVGLGEGAQDQVKKEIASLGSNLLVVSPGSSTSTSGVRGGFGSATTLTTTDADAMADATVAPDVKAIAPTASMNAELVAGPNNWTTSLTGTTPSWPNVRARTMQSGRFFTQPEVDHAENVVVLGSDTASELFTTGNPVGQTLTVQGRTLTVIGVLQSSGSSASGSSNDDTALVPLSTEESLSGSGSASLSTIYVEGQSQSTLGAAYNEINSLLLNLHGLPDVADADFTINSQDSLLTTANSTNKTLTVLLGGIAAISLLVGGIGVMNIMLVSVTERIREIGLRKALGATPQMIRRQFLVEASTLGLLGGLIGVLMGLIGAHVLPPLIGQPVSVSVLATIGAILVSLGLGIGFGVYPASRAARLTPIDALRSE